MNVDRQKIRRRLAMALLDARRWWLPSADYTRGVAKGWLKAAQLVGAVDGRQALRIQRRLDRLAFRTRSRRWRA